jgi:hypothetical protein
MRSVADLVHHGVLVKLATSANLRLGRKIVDHGGVELAWHGPLRASAKVGDLSAAAQRRIVELTSSASGLEWSCTCTTRRDLFCEHCVATALVLRERAAFSAPPQPRPM